MFSVPACRSLAELGNKIAQNCNAVVSSPYREKLDQLVQTFSVFWTGKNNKCFGWNIKTFFSLSCTFLLNIHMKSPPCAPVERGALLDVVRDACRNF